NGSRIIWDGPMTFSPSYFHDLPVVFVVEDNTTPTPTPTPTPTDTPTTAVPPDDDRSLGLWLGVVAAVLLGGGLALYRLLGDSDRPDGSPAGAASPDEDSGGEPPAGADASADADAEPSSEDGGDEPEPTPDGPFAGVDEELLSDEERVLRLIEANGGRMKQADIVTETGWSNAKVSQLLSGMAEDGDVDKLRIGRENLISLPDVDVGEVE
ncbi:MAG: helix-turn-helix domain-containing protein, partial [Halobacteriales archaeon]